MARRSRPPELPFAGDPSTRFLPGIVALMVLLSTLALAGALVLDVAVGDWRRNLTARLTVEIPPGENAASNSAAALEALRATAGIGEVRLLPEEEVRALLRPWLGEAAGRQELPLPRLIDASIGGAVDLATLRNRLADAAPGAVLDDHRDWLASLVDLARGLEGLAFLVIALVGASAMAAVVFVVRSGLAIHHGVVEFLHLIGAQDAYIGRQFEHQILRLGARGAGLGALGVVLVGTPVALLARALEGPEIAAPSLAAWHWALIACMPLAAIIAAGVTARVTLRRALARLP